MSRSGILVVTNEQDVGADFLIRELGHRRIPVVRLNTERSPEWQLTLRPLGEWRVSRGRRELNSADCAGVWWRRPEPPAVSGATTAAGEAVRDQWHAFLNALAGVSGPTWVSHPARIRAAENKALQLRSASELGLAVPESLWTNDLEEARAFVERWRGTAVVKSVTTAWWEEEEQARFVYAQLVGVDGLPTARGLASAPVCFQQPIRPKRDVRVTVIDDVVLAAIREYRDDEPLDWRRAAAHKHNWAPHELPESVCDGCRALVGAFDLRFSGIDLVVDDEGQHWFLEMNPNGEWGWLQRVGLSIAEALVDALLSGTS